MGGTLALRPIGGTPYMSSIVQRRFAWVTVIGFEVLTHDDRHDAIVRRLGGVGVLAIAPHAR